APPAFDSYDIAAGSSVTASSTWQGGKCANNLCMPVNVLDPTPANPDDLSSQQWISDKKACSAERNESLSFDWSKKYTTRLLSEIRFRYGDIEAGKVGLVLYSEIPMNVPNPTAVTFEDNANWTVFVFNKPVTASGMQITFYDLKSDDGGKNCFVAVNEVQAWTGTSPNSNPNDQSGQGSSDPAPSPAKAGLSAGAIAAIVLVPIAALLVVGGVWMARTRRANLLKTRLAREVELARRSSTNLGADPTADTAPIVEGSNKPLSPRTRNYLDAIAKENQAQANRGSQA
ncbi:hypothetical protein HDU96_010993, partial [Phlyctochytrium bullatum]